MQPKILLVEDNKTNALLTCRVLNTLGHRVKWLENGLEAKEYLKKNLKSITLAMIDLGLPGLSGMRLCEYIKVRRASCCVIILTADSQGSQIVRAFRYGADDYIKKPYNSAELVERVKRMMKIYHPIMPETIRFNHLEFRDVCREVRKYDNKGKCIEQIKFTGQESIILAYLIKNYRLSVGREKIISSLFGQESMMQPNSIDSHIRNIRKKLRSPGRKSIIKTIHGVGYKFEVDGVETPKYFS